MSDDSILTKDEQQKIKACWDRVHFAREGDSAAYSNILIKDLLKIIDRLSQEKAQQRE